MKFEERLEKLLPVVQRCVGAVRVNPQLSDISSKDPFFLISLLGTLK